MGFANTLLDSGGYTADAGHEQKVDRLPLNLKPAAEFLITESRLGSLVTEIFGDNCESEYLKPYFYSLDTLCPAILNVLNTPFNFISSDDNS